MGGPLCGVRVVELAGMGPGPHAAMLLADLGADVVRVERPGGDATVLLPPEQDFVLRGRRSVTADLKSAEGRELVDALVRRADVLIEGFRPGVMARLGFGPEDCLALNPRLIYASVTGWGQDGPLAERAGHDINYLAVSGVLHAIGRAGGPPVPPLNLVGDLGGGSMFLALGVLAALLERGRSGKGQVVDAAIVDGSSLLMQMVWGLHEAGLWSLERGTNVVDTGAPFYDTYECRDGRYVAVGAVEPAFYAQLLMVLGLDSSALPDQLDRSGWPRLRTVLAEAFLARTRDEWAEAFADTDACVSPVLDLDEAAAHPQLVARSTVSDPGNGRQAMPAPRFSRSRPGTPSNPPVPGQDTASVRAEWDAADNPSVR
ncbi:CaiB/BaiF CoA transferase family protein [Prauserella flavalba]|uniref:Carnitine dehydratase n=1 Tax=Prauserella flavalba TaxID=1477506 RepID=A0A318LDS7_9PSEU|nr:CaiB/BaiF CoA-transferase family protein [Prauserella flavalba]PXY18443.1 carnitine dehydratase [Prauserella flavalba]